MKQITEKEFRMLADYIKKNFGIHLKTEKMSLVTGRLNSYLEQNKFESFSAFYDYVINDKTGAAVTALMDRITTNHTYFMRESVHFDFFKEKVVPYLVNTINDKDMRIWSAGCSSGEEAYTLEMIVKEVLGDKAPLWDTKILATDISNRVLETAVKGVYTNESISSLPATWRLTYFDKTDATYSTVKDSLKKEVLFRKFNLMEKTYPFRKKFHVIFCRNVMIYFDNETKNEVVNKFYNCLELGGYLFIGHSESINRETSDFKYVMPSVYRKI